VRIGAPRPETFVLVGQDQATLPVLLHPFDPAPCRLAIVGDLWLSQVFVWRCVAASIRVVVRTDRPDRWVDLAAAAGGDRFVRVADLAARRAPEPARTIVIWDGLGLSGSGRPPFAFGSPGAGAWPSAKAVAQALVVREESPELLPLVAAASATILSRQHPEVVASLAGPLKLSPAAVRSIPTMPNGHALCLSRRFECQVQLRPTATENRVLGRSVA
jgi:hypothetical protein